MTTTHVGPDVRPGAHSADEAPPWQRAIDALGSEDIAVAPADGEAEPAQIDLESPSASTSPLRGLRERISAARKKSYVDIAVPGLGGEDEPVVVVRYRALRPAEVTRVTETHRKASPQLQQLRIASSLLIEACLGVYQVDPVDNQTYSVDPDNLHGTWLRFSDERLADLLDVTSKRAMDVVTALYVEPMHVLAVADSLSEWSTTNGEALVRADLGG